MRGLASICCVFVVGCGPAYLPVEAGGPEDPPVDDLPQPVLLPFSASCPDVAPDEDEFPIIDLVDMDPLVDNPCDIVPAYGIRAATWLLAHRQGQPVPDMTFIPLFHAAGLSLNRDDPVVAVPASTSRLSPSPVQDSLAWADASHNPARLEAGGPLSTILDAFANANPGLPVVPMTVEPDARSTIPGFSWVDGHRLAGAAGAGFTSFHLERTARTLASEGVTLLVSLTEWEVSRSLVEMHGVRMLRLPVRDFSAPTQEQLATFLHEVAAEHAAGGAAAVHCSAGRGRTGTMLAAYFVNQGMTADEAIAHVRDLRPGSIETTSQEQSLHTLAESMGQ